MNKKPKVSVVTSVYNVEPYLAKTLDSLIHQTYQDFEIVIVDDGSTDATPDIVKSYQDKCPDKIRHYHQENKGAAVARNNAISYANGEYIAILDGDDLATADRLERQVQYLNAHPNTALVGSDGWIINDDDEKLRLFDIETDGDVIKNELYNRNQFYHSSVMFRKSIIEKIHYYYREEMKCSIEDYDMYLRIAQHYDLTNLKEPLCMWRINPRAGSVVRRVDQMKFAKALGALAKEKNLSEIDNIYDYIEVDPKNIFEKFDRRAKSYFYWAQYLFNLKDYQNSLHYIYKALLYKPFNLHIWKYFIEKMRVYIQLLRYKNIKNT